MRRNPLNATGVGEEVVQPARPVIGQVMLPRPQAPCPRLGAGGVLAHGVIAEAPTTWSGVPPKRVQLSGGTHEPVVGDTDQTAKDVSQHKRVHESDEAS